MKKKQVTNTKYYNNYEYRNDLDYFSRLKKKYSLETFEIRKKEKKEDADIYTKYTSPKRENFFMENFFDEFNEYYNSLEKTFIEY